METKPYPIDFEALCIGSRVSEAEIVAYCGLEPANRMYQLKGVLAMIDLIRRHRPDLDTYVRGHGTEVVVMDDPEASRWRDRSTRQAIRRVLVEHRRNLGVDVRRLPDDERERHDRALVRNGRIVDAVVATKKELRAEAVRSALPKPK